MGDLYQEESIVKGTLERDEKSGETSELILKRLDHMDRHMRQIQTGSISKPEYPHLLLMSFSFDSIEISEAKMAENEADLYKKISERLCLESNLEVQGVDLKSYGIVAKLWLTDCINIPFVMKSILKELEFAGYTNVQRL